MGYLILGAITGLAATLMVILIRWVLKDKK